MSIPPPMPPVKPSERPWLNRAVNRSALIAAAFLAGVGVMRLIAVLIDREALPLRPVDGWLMMGLRLVAVLFALGMTLVGELRRHYLLLLLALVMLTSAGLGLHLGTLLPVAWQPTAGVALYLMSVLGLGFLIAGLAQGEDLVAFFQDTWMKAFARPPAPPPEGES